MFRNIVSKISQNSALPQRARNLDILKRVLDGSLYDHLPYDFHTEDNGLGGFIPMEQRAPSVRYNLCRLVVEESVAFLFGEGRFPQIYSEDIETRELFKALIKETRLNRVMRDAAFRGSIGSSAILMRVLKNRLFFDVIDTTYLNPVWKQDEPDALESVTERYMVRGSDLRDMGYDIPPEQSAVQFWFSRQWDTDSETWFIPQPVSERKEKRLIDSARTVEHRLGFVPIVWIKNLPPDDDIDGASTFAGAIDTQIQIEYLLSQAGRALKIMADPLLMIRSPSDPDGDFNRNSSNALIVDTDGDAKLLEINGASSTAITDYCRTLREFALEAIHGNRASPDKLAAGAISGKAMELLHLPLITLADNLRTSYGEDGLLSLAKMVLRASEVIPIKVSGKIIRSSRHADSLSLRWSNWFPATETDRNTQAQTLQMLKAGGIISTESAVQTLAPNYDIENVGEELGRIREDEAANDARAQKDSAQIKGTLDLES